MVWAHIDRVRRRSHAFVRCIRELYHEFDVHSALPDDEDEAKGRVDRWKRLIARLYLCYRTEEELEDNGRQEHQIYLVEGHFHAI